MTSRTISAGLERLARNIRSLPEAQRDIALAALRKAGGLLECIPAAEAQTLSTKSLAALVMARAQIIDTLRRLEQ